MRAHFRVTFDVDRERYARAHGTDEAARAVRRDLQRRIDDALRAALNEDDGIGLITIRSGAA